MAEVASEKQKQSHSPKVAKKPHLKRGGYSDDIVHLVVGLRAAPYKMGGTDLAYLFGKLDLDKSGVLNADEFKRALRRFVDRITAHDVYVSTG